MASFPELPNLLSLVETAISLIPRGRVTTFGSIARALGDVRAARWVAQSLRKQHQTIYEDWHRVVKATGEVVGSDDIAASQIARLKVEGVEFTADGCVDLKQFLFEVQLPNAPLKRLIEWQQEMAALREGSPLRELPNLIGGVDLAYPEPMLANAALVIFDRSAQEIVARYTVTAAVEFPYIPGYLTFREVPPLLKLYDTAQAERHWPSVVLVDGNGVLHPRSRNRDLSGHPH